MSSHLAVLKNAERLVHDAQHLFDAGRFRSSIAIAILAAEEIGKLTMFGLNDEERTAIVRSSGQTFERKLSNHTAKLDAFFSFCLIQMMSKVERATLEVTHLPDNREGRKALQQIIGEKIGQVPNLKMWSEQIAGGGVPTDFACAFTNAYLAIFGDADGFGDVSGQIGIGISNRLKQFGFYADAIDPASPTGEDEQEDARRWIRVVQQVLGSDVLKATMAGIERQRTEI